MAMRRDLSRLLDTTFDLLVVGGGIHGATIAWDACLRGLSVAIVDRADFGAATSANSLRIVHGGLRYLARGDLPRMLESIRERSTLLRIAPGLVEPLPVLIPTYRMGLRGRGALGTALLVNDLISLNRNRGLQPDRFIPGSRLVSREECLRLFPWFSLRGLTGGALWYDARMRHPERLTLSFVRSAAERGAVPANYVRVDQLLVRDGRAQGATVTDLERGSQFEIRSRAIVVAAGPWTPELIAGTLGQCYRGPAAGRALAVNVVIDRTLADVAVGTQSRSGLDADPVGGGRRFLFAAPQNGRTLLGTWYTIADGTRSATPEQGLRSLVREFNQACPGLELSAHEVARCQWGWLPLKGSHEWGRPTALAERPRIVDHGTAHNIRHLLSVEGVKYTTARRVAERVVDWVFQDLGKASPRCRTAELRLDGPGKEGTPRTDGTLAPDDIRRAVHQEMALKLSDILFRRSNLVTATQLSRTRVTDTAQLAGAELGWDRMRQQAEVEEVMRQVSVLPPSEELVG
jgi:glycerol-3-phosphate dehydrogenase